MLTLLKDIFSLKIVSNDGEEDSFSSKSSQNQLCRTLLPQNNGQFSWRDTSHLQIDLHHVYFCSQITCIALETTKLDGIQFEKVNKTARDFLQKDTLTPRSLQGYT